MKLGQRGTVRDGQKGVIVEVFTNAGIFQSDTGARFTVLTCEFTPDDVTPEQQAKITKERKALFGNFPTSGFHYRIVRDGHGHVVEAQCGPLAGPVTARVSA